MSFRKVRYKNFNFKIDYIILKTLLAVAICILVAYKTQNHNVIFFGGVASIVCMQHTYKHTLKAGGYRFIGTLIGGFIGILTVLICTLVPQHLIILSSFIIALFSMFAIYLCNLLSLSDSTFINCVVFLNVISNHDGKDGVFTACLYVSERVIYTLLGIGVAYLINHLIHLHKTNYQAPRIGGKIIKKIKSHNIAPNYSLGLRAFKTTFAIFISVIIAYILNNPAAIFFCGIAVVTCMQRDYKTTISVGYTTFLGTILGGLLGFLVAELCNFTTKYTNIVEFLLILIAIFIILYFCRLFNYQNMIPETCIIFLRMISQYNGFETNKSMFFFLLNTVFLFTFIGIGIALFVNILPFEKLLARFSLIRIQQ